MIYRNLRSETMPESVHLCDFPLYHKEVRDEHLEAVMDVVQTSVSLGHALRKEHKLKVRQPLATAYIASSNVELLHFLQEQQHLVADELNVKNVVFIDDETKFVSLKAKPNFRVSGKKVGKLMKATQTAIDQFDRHQLTTLMNGQDVTINLEGEAIVLTPEDVEVERIVREGIVAANLHQITIALDTVLSGELLMEGLSREVVNKINTMRREASFDVTDRISIRLQTSDRVKECWKIYGDYINGEVLAVEVVFGEVVSEAGTEWNLNGEPARIELKRM